MKCQKRLSRFAMNTNPLLDFNLIRVYGIWDASKLISVKQIFRSIKMFYVRYLFEQ